MDGKARAAEPLDAAGLEFMMESSARDAGFLLCGRRPEAGRPLAAGDVAAEGERIEPLPGCGKVRVTHVRHVVSAVHGACHYSYAAEAVSSEAVPFGEFRAGPLWDAAMEAWGDGDPDHTQVGNARADVARDGSSLAASIDMRLQRRGWPRRPVGRTHDDLTVELDESGRVGIYSESMRASLECGAGDLFELYELGRKCKEAGVGFEGGRVCVPVGAA